MYIKLSTSPPHL